MVLVDERIPKTKDMVLVVRVKLIVQLDNTLSGNVHQTSRNTRHLQDGDLHHTLIEVRGLVFYHLHGQDLIRFRVLALDDLPEGSLPQHVQNQVSDFPHYQLRATKSLKNVCHTFVPLHYPASH